MFLLCTTLSLVIGLYFARSNIVISILITIAYLVFVLWRFGRKKFIVFIAFFAIGVFIPRVTLPRKDTSEYKGFVIEAKDNYYIFQSRLERFYVPKEGNDFELGDFIVLKGEEQSLRFTTYESQFDFTSYLGNKGIKKQFNANETKIIFRNLLRTKAFKNRFLSKFDQNTATLISAFLFNDKDYSNDIIQNADANNVLYLLTLSGTYLHTLFAIANYLLLLRFSKKRSRILTFIIFLPFAFFSFTKIGTLRVYGLYLLKYLTEFVFKKRKFTHIELVSLLALFFLIIDYHLVYQEAFYIGFLLSIFAPIVLNSIKFMTKGKRRVARFILFIGLLLPLRVRSSYLTPFYLIRFSIIMPLTTIFLIVAMMSTVLPLYIAVNFIGKGVIWVLEKMDATMLRIPFGDWGGTFPFLFISVFLLLVFYLEGVRIRHAKIAGLCLLLITTISIVPLQEPISNCVYFVNVGQGDSIIIKNRIYTVMIDTGGYKGFDMAQKTLIPFMNKKKITHIDALILTHDDFDHTGAKDTLIKNFKVKEVLTEKDQFPYKIGNLYIKNLNTFDFTEDNDKSLVLSLEFMNKKFLFTGDASIETEKMILKNYDVDCDILKIGHHGSKTSSSEEFIKATSPNEAIISCGAKNYYGHPHKEVIDRLKKYNVKIRRTDEEGTICYFSLIS